MTYRVENRGNVRMGGRQQVSISGPFGLFGKQNAFTDLPELLPGEGVDLRVEFDGGVPATLVAVGKVRLEPAAGGPEPDDDAVEHWRSFAFALPFTVHGGAPGRLAAVACPPQLRPPQGGGPVHGGGSRGPVRRLRWCRGDVRARCVRHRRRPGRPGPSRRQRSSRRSPWRPPQLQPGDRVIVSLVGWTARNVTLSVCGNLARRGAVDCNLIASQALKLVSAPERDAHGVRRRRPPGDLPLRDPSVERDPGRGRGRPDRPRRMAGRAGRRPGLRRPDRGLGRRPARARRVSWPRSARRSPARPTTW